MKIPFKWEMINENTRRARVIGGWIVNSWERDSDDNGEGVGMSESMVFIPDPKHEWEV